MKRVEPYLADADLVLVKRLGQTPSIVANCASHPHDPAEIDRLDPFTDRIPYDWAPRHG